MEKKIPKEPTVKPKENLNFANTVPYWWEMGKRPMQTIEFCPFLARQKSG